MKTNDYLLLTGTLGYSYLFYEQNAGINFLLFTLLFAGILLVRNKDLLKEKKWLWALSLCMISGIGIFITSSALAVIANCCSLLLLSGFSVNVKTSAIFAFLFSMFSVVSGVIWMLMDAIARSSKKQGEISPQNKNGRKAFAIILVIALCILFFGLYKQANPLFAENTKWINLDFLSLNWFLFTFGAFFLVYPLFYHKTIKPIENWENNLSPATNKSIEADVSKIQTERFAGISLFIFLNLMLVVLNVGDITSIWFNLSLPKDITHSDFVHNGVGTIIFSIMIATGLIMFLFRKNFNEFKNSKLLRLLVYAWIVQNLVMLFSTAIRNEIYIHTYNFTYKRAGVYVWLALAVIGLVITFVKIMNNRSNWYLVKNNFAIWFSVLSLCSLLNWDLLITRYNIANKPLRDVDFYYLFSLSDSNIPELIAVTNHNDFPAIKDTLKNFTNRGDYYYERDYMTLLNSKIKHFVRNYNNDWQSFDLRDKRITNTLYK